MKNNNPREQKHTIKLLFLTPGKINIIIASNLRWIMAHGYEWHGPFWILFSMNKSLVRLNENNQWNSIFGSKENRKKIKTFRCDVLKCKLTCWIQTRGYGNANHGNFTWVFANCESIYDLFQRISFVVFNVSVIIHRTQAISPNIISS